VLRGEKTIVAAHGNSLRALVMCGSTDAGDDPEHGAGDRRAAGLSPQGRFDRRIQAGSRSLIFWPGPSRPRFNLPAARSGLIRPGWTRSVEVCGKMRRRHETSAAPAAKGQHIAGFQQDGPGLWVRELPPKRNGTNRPVKPKRSAPAKFRRRPDASPSGASLIKIDQAGLRILRPMRQSAPDRSTASGISGQRAPLTG